MQMASMGFWECQKHLPLSPKPSCFSAGDCCSSFAGFLRKDLAQLIECRPEVRRAQMCIALRRLQIPMAKDLFDREKISSLHNQPTGRRVSQIMKMKIVNPCL